MSESALKARIIETVKAAMKALDKPRRDAIRLIQSELKRVEVDERIELDDARVLAILDKMVKQRRESISLFQAANRQDLVDSETAELLVIQEFLPQALSAAELDALLEAAFAESGATGMKDMGKVIGILRGKFAGQMDFGKASGLVKAKLQ